MIKKETAMNPNTVPLLGAKSIGSPKTLSEWAPLTVDEQAHLFEAADHLISQGMPLEVSTALPQGDLLKIVRTVQYLAERVKYLEANPNPLPLIRQEAGE